MSECAKSSCPIWREKFKEVLAHSETMLDVISEMHRFEYKCIKECEPEQ